MSPPVTTTTHIAVSPAGIARPQRPHVCGCATDVIMPPKSIGVVLAAAAGGGVE